MENVLIVEDNPAMLRGLQDNFELKGYHVSTARDGELGLNAALTENPDLIVLDVMLPKINGFDICSRIRKSNLDMPIIILTAKGEESDIILGLNLGADDYVTKPFSIKELLARVGAIMRRRTKTEPAVYEFGDCQLDVDACTLTRNGRQVKLTQGEFKMLHLLLRRAECTLTCDEIRNNVWGYSRFITLKDIDNTVVTLRNKVERDPGNPTLIRTIDGIGYKFEMPKSACRELVEPNGNNLDN